MSWAEIHSKATKVTSIHEDHQIEWVFQTWLTANVATMSTWKMEHRSDTLIIFSIYRGSVLIDTMTLIKLD